jgi:alkylhydroperoxidase family enzyme
MNATLLPLLQNDAVPMETLHRRYGRLLDPVRVMIGVVPNSFPCLEIWPVGLRSFNVMIPNFLNLPFSLLGLGAPIAVVSLAMYSASVAAGCAYCSAHCCSFALRRGASAESIAGVLDGSSEPGAGAVVEIARALSCMPLAVTARQRADLEAQFPAAQVEWIVLAIAMMGFLNKFMDVVGVELEPEIAGHAQALIAPSGWRPGKHFAGTIAGAALPRADSIARRLGVLRSAPAAISADRKWTAGVPSRWPAAGEFLRTATGHDFPVLARLRHGRAIRAIAATLRDNLDAATSVIGLPLKAQLGRVFAEAIGNNALAGEMEVVAQRHPGSVDDPRAQAALRLTRAASSSPAQIDSGTVEACGKSGLSAAAVVEIVVWLALLQMLHRLSAFYRA